MLEIQRCVSLQAKREAFAHFKPNSQTWVVSDLQSKSQLQNELLDRFGVLTNDCVMRATELWKSLSFRIQPNLQLMSPELAQTLFWNWIESMELPWARSPQTVPVLLKQMKMWMNLISSDRSEEIMAQWFQDHPESYVRWGHWFELCGILWKRCQEKNLMMLDWLPAMLVGQDLHGLQWPKQLIFDLGPQISLVEGQLIRDLSQYQSVKILFPEAPWLGLMKNTLKPYDILLEENYQGDPNWEPTVDRAYSFGRFATQLAEVKDAVGRVRSWVEEGVNPNAIAIVAPDIEDYWPSLQLYLAEEGIPVSKPVCAKLSSFVEIAQWLSTLRTCQRRLSSNDLEFHFFVNRETPRLKFEEFRVLFTNVYDARDMDRARELFDTGTSIDTNMPLSLSAFLGWSLGFWSQATDNPRLVTLLHILGTEVPQDFCLKPGEWLSYIEGLVARREIVLQPAALSGVSCVSLTSADWLPVTHGIFLNLCEDALRRLEHSPVSVGEAQKIFTDTGYAIGTSDRQELEFELLWFLNRPWQNLHLCYSATDFQGGVLTPSRLWMWAAFANNQLRRDSQIPRSTRWDEIQSLSPGRIARLREWSAVRAEKIERALSRDIDIQAHLPWGRQDELKISASGIERYWQCPFVYAAERKLKLSDDPVLDLDLDRRTRGSLLHALVEDLAREPMRFDYSEPELEELVEACRVRENVRMGDSRLWPAIRAQHVQLCQQFLSFEKEWRLRFPTTRTLATENAFECYWDVEQARPTGDSTIVRLAGRLDRIDVDSQNRYALIDYKASASQNTNWNSWLNNGSVQMALYSLLLENGLAGLPAGVVAAANYYVVRDKDRRKGFHLRDDNPELYSSDDGHRNWITLGEKKELFKQVSESIQEAVESMVEGKFPPTPEDQKNCLNCAWRNLCRAPHLN